MLTTHGDPQRAVLDAVARMLAQERLPAGRHHPRGARHHPADQRADRAAGRASPGCSPPQGFRDTLEIGRERKYDLYDIAIENPAPLVPRALRQEVAERIGPRGEVIVPLDLADLRAKLAVLQAAGVTSVAVMFLHAYADPAHEQAAADASSASGRPTCRSRPRTRWRPRCGNTTASPPPSPAPTSSRWPRATCTALSDGLAGLGVTAPLLLMLSNGGLTHVAEVVRNPVQMLESGPAAGALAAAFFGRRDACHQTCSASTWAAPPPSSAWWRMASR